MIFKLYDSGNPCRSIVTDAELSLEIDIKILVCPIGFELRDYRCECDSRLSQFTQSCTIHNLTRIFRRDKNNFWISLSSNADALIIHEYRCPLDYCKNDFVNVTLDDPSIQCDFNRMGILCGNAKMTSTLPLVVYIVLYAITTILL